MTRTERNTSKHAIIRDRSVSKNGHDKSDPKGGAGKHNWGSYTDEQELEFQANLDNDGFDRDEESTRELSEAVQERKEPQIDGSLNERQESGVSEEEREEARQFRHKAFKKGADLNSIARTSAAVSTSPPGNKSSVRVLNDATTSQL